ncbi:hypothetical protein BAUCODRAFT_24663 [Baudoinia panamericana UAMH 10762]|uniref:Uncharacterized protein n=1 Tax=Baudoinia panamericana (strain UAMH 10762) TaxID=717646 RepID=M2N963_BAUPA|nr:uncharacterized protein BAUCODRAFT_24663 [Baudoinia panamericana UAMH 10762]EMC95629.1 hypothetical protein BAUCODRAFT_24663 [Baudoinia panamericana UAMH 10762]
MPSNSRPHNMPGMVLNELAKQQWPMKLGFKHKCGSPVVNGDPLQHDGPHKTDAQPAVEVWHVQSNIEQDPPEAIDTSRFDRPRRTYNVVSVHVFTQTAFEIQLHGRPVLCAVIQRRCFSKDCVSLHQGSEKGPIVASCMLGKWKRDLAYHVGIPGGSDKDSWPVAKCDTWTEKAWNFTVGGRPYSWRRTHNRELGASRWSIGDFKLVDILDSKKVLAVHLRNMKIFGGWKDVAKIDLFTELDEELTLTSLVIIMTIEERIAQQSRSCTVSGMLNTAVDLGTAGGA